MSGNASAHHLVLDDKKSWKNVPVALAPAAVGVWLLTAPWTLNVNPSMVAPIMIPFGLVWLVIAFCISSYHSYMVLDHEKGEVVYNICLALHSWANRVVRGNVSKVVVEPVSTKYRFVMQVIDGDDLTVTTSDYWHCREWAEQVSSFLDVPLVDECRHQEELSPEDLGRSIRDQAIQVEFPGEAPEGIVYEKGEGLRATIVLPSRGFGKSQYPRLVLVTAILLTGLALYGEFGGLSPLVGLVVGAWAWSRPLARATHREELTVSPNGLLTSITILGRSNRTSLASTDIRDITLVEGKDVRFEHADFDRHAVCVETSEGHLQVGAHLAKRHQVEWLQQALLFLLTRKPK